MSLDDDASFSEMLQSLDLDRDNRRPRLASSDGSQPSQAERKPSAFDNAGKPQGQTAPDDNRSRDHDQAADTRTMDDDHLNSDSGSNDQADFFSALPRGFPRPWNISESLQMHGNMSTAGTSLSRKGRSSRTNELPDLESCSR